MIKEYTKQINNLLEKINEEHEENMNDLVSYATSTELNVGGQLCRYGELYKIVLDSESFDEIIQDLEKLRYKERFEVYDYVLEDLQNYTYFYIRGDYDFLKGREELLTKIKEEYILKTIVDCL